MCFDIFFNVEVETCENFYAFIILILINSESI